MIELCEGLIDDYLAEKISLDEFKENVQSLLLVSPDTNTLVQEYLKELLSKKTITVKAFKELSQLISQITIDNTVDHITLPEIISTDEDQSINLSNQPLVEEDEDITTASFVVDKSKETEPLNPKEDTADPKKVFKERRKSKPFTDRRSQKKHKDLGPGVLLKDRFVLLERLGQGGMGVVFKAKDLLKVEAQDKNPYVAIKVLTEAFKQYSGSFIALQREASKAQKVAHPNIATVYDFDRDGDVVFMTMEFLKGTPLNRLIKGLKNNPISKEKALGMIEDLCHGLDYAHKQNLIHSDFKPGNCFLLNDGTVKLLDFGISRANSKAEDEHENTLFDPSKLSAVTPAYATIEMFAGMDPDPRDDIYGLACVSYQLLAGGRHPFNKVAMPKIKDLGIKPKPIPGLSRQQQKGLLKALEIDRSSRTATVSEFLKNLKTTKTYTKTILLSAFFILIIAASAAYKPYLSFMAEQEAMDKMQMIKKGDQALLIETIWSLNQLDPDKKKFFSVGLRREIITYYKHRIETVFNIEKNAYDFPKAQSLLNQVSKLYPDSIAISTIEDVIFAQKEKALFKFTNLLKQFVELDSLLKTDFGLDVPTAFNIIHKIDPDHPSINDSQLSQLYLKKSETYVSQNEHQKALQYLNTGLTLFPNDLMMKNLASQLNVELK